MYYLKYFWSFSEMFDNLIFSIHDKNYDKQIFFFSKSELISNSEYTLYVNAVVSACHILALRV